MTRSVRPSRVPTAAAHSRPTPTRAAGEREVALVVNGQGTQLAGGRGVLWCPVRRRPCGDQRSVEHHQRGLPGRWPGAIRPARSSRVVGTGVWAVARQGVRARHRGRREVRREPLAGIAEDGTVAFAATLIGPDVPTGTGEAILSEDGSAVLVRSGYDIPYGQVDENGFETFFSVRTLDIDDGALSLRSAPRGRFIVGRIPGAGRAGRIVCWCGSIPSAVPPSPFRKAGPSRAWAVRPGPICPSFMRG